MTKESMSDLVHTINNVRHKIMGINYLLKKDIAHREKCTDILGRVDSELEEMQRKIKKSFDRNPTGKEGVRI